MTSKRPNFTATATIPAVRSDGITITSPNADISVLVNRTEVVDISVKGLAANENVDLQLWVQHDDLIKVDPTTLTLDKNDQVYTFAVTGLHPGYASN